MTVLSSYRPATGMGKMAFGEKAIAVMITRGVRVKRDARRDGRRLSR